jgi:hypothetical protein
VYFLVSHGRAEYGDEKQILKIEAILASLSGKMVERLVLTVLKNN